MIYDIKHLAAPTNLFLMASIDFEAHNLLARAATWCYQPCRWAFGREVVAFSTDKSKPERYSVETIRPLLKIFELPWVQTFLRIVVYIPTLFGRILQAWAERRDADFKQSFYAAREAVANDRLINVDLTNTDTRKLAENEVEVLLPSYELREILAAHVFEDCALRNTEKVNRAAGFLMQYVGGGGFWIVLGIALADDFNDDKTNQRLIRLVKAFAEDAVNGAESFEKLFSNTWLHNGKKTSSFNMLTEPLKHSQPLALEYNMIECGLKHLTEPQKKILAARLAEGKGFGGYNELSACILLYLDFYGVDKLQTCEQMLFGLKVEANPKDPYDNGSIAALSDDSYRAKMYQHFTVEQLKDLFQRRMKTHFRELVRDFRNLDLKVIKPMLEIFTPSQQAIILSEAPLDHFRGIFKLFKDTPMWKSFSLADFGRIFTGLHRLRLENSNENGQPINSDLITPAFLKSLSPQQLSSFIYSNIEALHQIMRKECLSLGILHTHLSDSYFTLENLAKLQKLKIQKGDKPDWKPTLLEWGKQNLVYSRMIQMDDPDISFDKLEKIFVGLPLQYFAEVQKIIQVHPEVFDTFVNHSEEGERKEITEDRKYAVENILKPVISLNQIELDQISFL